MAIKGYTGRRQSVSGRTDRFGKAWDVFDAQNELNERMQGTRGFNPWGLGKPQQPKIIPYGDDAIGGRRGGIAGYDAKPYGNDGIIDYTYGKPRLMQPDWSQVAGGRVPLTPYRGASPVPLSYYPTPSPPPQQPQPTPRNGPSYTVGITQNRGMTNVLNSPQAVKDQERELRVQREQEAGMARLDAKRRASSARAAERTQYVRDLEKRFYDMYGFRNTSNATRAAGSTVSTPGRFLNWQELEEAVSGNPGRHVRDKIFRSGRNKITDIALREQIYGNPQKEKNLRWAAKLGIDVPDILAQNPTSAEFIDYVQNARRQLERKSQLEDLQSQLTERELREQLGNNNDAQFVNEALASAIRDIQARYTQLGRYGSPEMYNEIAQVQRQASLAAANKQYSNPYDFNAR